MKKYLIFLFIMFMFCLITFIYFFIVNEVFHIRFYGPFNFYEGLILFGSCYVSLFLGIVFTKILYDLLKIE